MSDQLSAKRVLVTGASRGIGRVVAGTLAGQGAELVLVARGADALAALAAELPGGPHQSVALDVSDERAWAEVEEKLAAEGPLHGLVTAAGVLGPIGPVGSWDVADFRATLDVNVTGTLLAVASTLEALVAGGGSIVTFSGGGATAPFPRFDAYAASKAAVVRLTENLAVSLAERGVRANSVAPGFIVTAMHDATIAAGPEAVGSDYYERTRRAIAEGTGDPPELAGELSAFLLSDAAAGITGKLLSARWDPWRDVAFQARLRAEKDLATLRRIDDQFFTTVEAVRR